MHFKSIVRELRDMRDSIGNSSRRRAEGKHTNRRGRSHIAPEGSPSSSALFQQQSQWANMPPELLLDIIQRVEAAEASWPARRDVVSCGSVCRSWRDITKEIVKTPEQCGCLTFPISLKQPGPRESQIQCFIKRERATSTFRLYLGLSPALSGDASKLLLAARKIRRATSTEFVISLLGDDFSRATNAYVGKLKSNFLGTKFTIYDSQPPHDPAVHGNYNVATISYELNVLRTRGPRRMHCTMHWIPISAIQEGGTAPTPMTFAKCQKDQFPQNPLVLKNKAPRWHEQLQCWCLNFKGRVTVASVKNFQLVAAVEPCQNVSVAEQEKVILQFGKIGKDIFTMDYRYPLSAFQAFAICLSSFDTKPACE
ncbi:unnamed protein product, partial [Vitis vinifera]